MQRERLRELLWKEQDFVDKIVPKIKDILRLDEKGNVYFLISYANLTDAQKLGLHLTARYFAEQLKVVESGSMSIKELSQRAGLNYDIAVARLKEMYDAGIVTKDKTKGTRYSILPHGITMIIEDVSKAGTHANEKSGASA